MKLWKSYYCYYYLNKNNIITIRVSVASTTPCDRAIHIMLLQKNIGRDLPTVRGRGEIESFQRNLLFGILLRRPTTVGGSLRSQRERTCFDAARKNEHNHSIRCIRAALRRCRSINVMFLLGVSQRRQADRQRRDKTAAAESKSKLYKIDGRFVNRTGPRETIVGRR